MINTKALIKVNDNIYKLKNIFKKNITCPVCENIFKAPTVKVKAPRIVSKESDLLLYKTVFISF